MDTTYRSQRIGGLVLGGEQSGAARRENFDTPPLAGRYGATSVACELPKHINNLQAHGSSPATGALVEENNKWLPITVHRCLITQVSG